MSLLLDIHMLKASQLFFFSCASPLCCYLQNTSLSGLWDLSWGLAPIPMNATPNAGYKPWMSWKICSRIAEYLLITNEYIDD